VAAPGHQKPSCYTSTNTILTVGLYPISNYAVLSFYPTPQTNVPHLSAHYRIRISPVHLPGVSCPRFLGDHLHVHTSLTLGSDTSFLEVTGESGQFSASSSTTIPTPRDEEDLRQPLHAPGMACDRGMRGALREV
jgi:hypothetical protein